MNGSKRNYMIYGTMLAVFGLLMWWVVRMGKAYDTSDVVAVRHADSSVDLLRETLASNLTHPVPLLLLQIIAILVAVRIFSYLFKYLGQPGVIGEIVAGIVLGPSVLGHFFPGAFEFLFEPSSLVPLNVISQIGLVLSKGHVAPGLYATLAQRGYFPKEDLKTLRHTGSYLQGHPDMKHIPGVDMSSGSLGQGLSAAVGMALAGKMKKKDYRVYAVTGDGEIQEGQIWEAAMFAGARKLDNLVVIVDNNNLQIDGAVSDVCSPYPIDKKFEAFNFHVINIDGNDFDEIRAALKEARETKGMPTAIIAKTIKGKGVSFMEDQAGWHGKAPNDEEYRIAMDELEKAGEALCRK